jgi:predicted membrane protein
MNFEVPQFIEQEAKILGPFTFKQTLWLIGTGAIIFFFYFSLAKTNLILFIILTIILAGIGFSLAFLKIHGYSLPVLLKHLLSFSFSSKIYLWKQTGEKQKIKLKKVEREEDKETEPVLKIVKKSQLKKLATQIETATK